MEKKTVVIGILMLIIISLIFLIFSGKGKADAALKALSEQRIEFARSTEIIERQLSAVQKYNQELEADSIELERIIDELTAGSTKTEEYISEYGGINHDFAEFLRQAEVTD